MHQISYTVRISQRAKHVRLVMHPEKGLEIIIHAQHISELVARHQAWIAKHLVKLPTKSWQLPPSIHLLAIGEHWQISYQDTWDATHLQMLGQGKLLCTWKMDDYQTIYQLLRQWLLNKAKVVLPQLSQQTSKDINLTYQKVTVRTQKTLWASCSRHRNISLNSKLLFLPPVLVRYVCIHEPLS